MISLRWGSSGGGGGCGWRCSWGRCVDPLLTQGRATVAAAAGEISLVTAGEKWAEVGQELRLIIPGSVWSVQL